MTLAHVNNHIPDYATPGSADDAEISGISEISVLRQTQRTNVTSARPSYSLVEGQIAGELSNDQDP